MVVFFNFNKLVYLLNNFSVAVWCKTCNVADVAPEMLYAWQNEVYGWQHPNTITMPNGAGKQTCISLIT